MNAKERFLDAVQSVVDQCFVTVPSAPLLELTQALEADLETIDGEELDLMWELQDAAGSMEWDFYPPTENSPQALVDPCAVHDLNTALKNYLDYDRRSKGES